MLFKVSPYNMLQLRKQLSPLPTVNFDRLSFKTSKKSQPLKKKSTNVSDDLLEATVNIISQGQGSCQPRRRRQGVVPLPPTSRDSDYSPILGQDLVIQEDVFRNTRSRVAIPYYDQPSTARGTTSPGAMRHTFQWLGD